MQLVVHAVQAVGRAHQIAPAALPRLLRTLGLPCATERHGFCMAKKKAEALVKVDACPSDDWLGETLGVFTNEDSKMYTRLTLNANASGHSNLVCCLGPNYLGADLQTVDSGVPHSFDLRGLAGVAVR